MMIRKRKKILEWGRQVKETNQEKEIKRILGQEKVDNVSLSQWFSLTILLVANY